MNNIRVYSLTILFKVEQELLLVRIDHVMHAAMSLLFDKAGLISVCADKKNCFVFCFFYDKLSFQVRNNSKNKYNEADENFNNSKCNEFNTLHGTALKVSHLPSASHRENVYFSDTFLVPGPYTSIQETWKRLMYINLY